MWRIGLVPGVSLHPGVDLGGEGIHTGPDVVRQAMDGKSLMPLPQLHGARITIEVGRDLFPTVQPRRCIGVGG